MPAVHCRACAHRFNPAPSEQLFAPPPDPRDTIEHPCPRCGSYEVYRLNHQRLKAIPLLFTTAIFAVVPIWMMMPKRRCDSCGLTL